MKKIICQVGGKVKPISFKEQTKILKKPEGVKDDECSELPVWNEDKQRCISLWKANMFERIKFLFTGKIWLWVWYGQSQPPVCVEIENPFKENLSLGYYKKKLKFQWNNFKRDLRKNKELTGR